MPDARHYRERLADEVVASVRRKLPDMLPGLLNAGQQQALLSLIARAVSAAVNELDQREIWRTD